jgi:DNA repair exonuclease SbcCD nuclease subunit
MAKQRHVIAHIGDIHICQGVRLADKLAAVRQIIVWGKDIAARGELALILIPGDLFDKESVVADRNLLQPLIKELANLAPVILCDGNHDKPGDLLFLTETRAAFDIVLVSEPRVVSVTCATGIEAAVFCLPYPHKGGLVSSGVEHGDLAQTARQLLEPAFAIAAEELRRARERGAIPLFVGHVNVGGSISSTGQPQIGRELELDPGLLARLDAAVYKGLNHIHKHQVVAGDTVYAGSICRQDFGENEDKGFIVVTVEHDVAYEDTQARWEFIPLDVPAQHLVEGRLTREGFEIETINSVSVCSECGGRGQTIGTDVIRTVPVPVLVECPCAIPAMWKGADVKARVRYSKSETSALDWAHVHSGFAGCRSFKLDQIAELEHTVRVPEVAAAVTLEAKGEAYCAHRQIPWTSGIAGKLTALQQQTPEAILAELQAMANEAGRPKVAPQADRRVA